MSENYSNISDNQKEKETEDGSKVVL